MIAIPEVDNSFIAFYNDRPTESILEGVLLEPPDHREMYTNLRMRVEQIQTLDSNQVYPVHGQVLARVSPGSSFNYGDLIRLQGHIESPPEYEDFSYRDYLAIQGIYSYLPYPTATMLQHGQGNPLMSALYSFRQHALDLVYRLFPDPEASILAGILLGDQSGISPQVQEAFRLTGTSHIIVISGFNIAIIAALFSFLFIRFFGMFRGALLSAIGIILYTLLVGANPAVVRAAILGLFMLLGHLIGRRQVGLNSLIFVAAIMALITPSVLWDVSFQLSFAATLGIMLYAGLFTDGFTNFSSRFMPREKAEKVAGPVGEYLLVTIAALLTTLPIMVYYFKRISITSLIANPLILPAQPPIMILGGLSCPHWDDFPARGTIIRMDGFAFHCLHHPHCGVAVCRPTWLHCSGSDCVSAHPGLLSGALYNHLHAFQNYYCYRQIGTRLPAGNHGCDHVFHLESCLLCPRWIASCNRTRRRHR